MRSQPIHFRNRQGARLAARLDLPVAGPTRAYALFAHCFTCNKNFKAITNISRALAAAGIAVLRFDFTGLGESEGRFEDSTFSSNVEDLLDAAQFLATKYTAPALLIGHSLGGAAVLQAAGRIPSATAVVTIGAPADPSHVLRLLADSRATIERTGAAQIELMGRSFRITKQFLDDLEQVRMQETIANLRKALLVLHSPWDAVVDIDNASRIFAAARHPKSFVSLGQADHLLSDETDSRYVGALIAAWAQRYLAAPQPEPAQQAEQDSGVRVYMEREHYRTEVAVRGHALYADEPLDQGGTDTGPSPGELLLVALGSCTTITLRMYADRKGWPLESMTVRLRYEDVRSENDPRSPATRHIDCALILSGPLEEDQRARLLEIAKRCPVHRQLVSGIHVDVHLAD